MLLKVFREDQENYGMSKAFLSYTHSDGTFVERLAHDLLRTGIDVFLDTWEIGPGDSIVDKINEGIGASDFLVVVLSHSSIESKWVRHEMNNALMIELDSKEIIVIPIRIDEVAIPPLMRDRKYVDFGASYDDALNDLASALLRQSKLEKAVISVITYNPAHGTTRELSRDSFVYAGSSEFIEGIYVPYGLNHVELVLLTPGSKESGMYSYFFEKYDTHTLEAAPGISVSVLNGLDVAMWKVTINDITGTSAPKTRRLISQVFDAHNQQVVMVVSHFNMLNSFVGQSSISMKMRSPPFDRTAFLDAISDNNDICTLLSKSQIDTFAEEMESSMTRAEGVEIEIDEFFSHAFPFIVLAAYLKAKYPGKADEYLRFFAGLELGENPITEEEREPLLMLEFWVVASQESLRQEWAEYKLEHMTPNEASTLEQFFIEQGMAGALHIHGGVLGMLRLVAKDSFDAYFMMLMALKGVRSQDEDG